jgi:hypothetical protein
MFGLLSVSNERAVAVAAASIRRAHNVAYHSADHYYTVVLVPGLHELQLERFFASCVGNSTAVTAGSDTVTNSSNRSAAVLTCVPHSLINDVVEGFVVRSVTITAAEVGKCYFTHSNPMQCA